MRLSAQALALFRFSLGAVLASDALSRTLSLEIFASSKGLVSPSQWWSLFDNGGHFSVHALFSSLPVLQALGVAQILLAVAFAFGVSFRVTGSLLWILVVSLQNRVPPIEHGADAILRLGLFWGLFLPLDARWTLFSRKRDLGESVCVHPLAAWGLALQILFLYQTSLFHKVGEEWIGQGSALGYALSATQYTKPAGFALLELGNAFPGLLPLFTRAVVGLEFVAPFLLISPWRSARLGAFAALSLLHIGIFSTMDIGLFPWADIALLCAFLPLGAVPRGLPLREDRAVSVVLACAIGIIVAFNVSMVAVGSARVPRGLASVAKVFRLDQYWYMFAPSPPHHGGYIVVTGRLESGRDVDPWRPSLSPPSWEAPPSVSETYRDERWRLFLTTFALPNWVAYQPLFVDFLCRRWAEDVTARTDPEDGAASPLRGVRVFLVKTPNYFEDGRMVFGEPRAKELAGGDCGRHEIVGNL